MKRFIPIVISILAVSAVAFAQDDPIEKALLAAPPQLKEGATVVKWKSDFTYDTLKKGTNRLVCFDRTGQPGQQPFAVECTSIANLDRVAENLKYEAMGDKATVQAALAPGRLTAIVGPNGAGKSTLMAVMAGLRPPAHRARWCKNSTLKSALRSRPPIFASALVTWVWRPNTVRPKPLANSCNRKLPAGARC